MSKKVYSFDLFLNIEYHNLYEDMLKDELAYNILKNKWRWNLWIMILM